ncbi:hypothetical protein [Aquipuribacter sp. SD81]|uniref:hypothetical protein n=1 Tax=Aquipuribacter sp. SD81 TaxID=3127703 RepID=UPI003019A67D
MQPVVQPFAPGRLPATAPGGRQAGFTTGYAAGYAEGLRRAGEAALLEQARRRAAREAEAERDRARLLDLLLALRGAETDRAERARTDVDALVDVVAAAAARLAHDAVLEAAPGADALRARLVRAVAVAGEAAERDGVVARLSPAGARVLERAGLLPDALPAGVRVVPDASLADGDVVVRAGATTVTDLLADALAALAHLVPTGADA